MKFFASALIGSSLLSAALALPAVLRGLSASQVPDSTAKLAFDDEAGLIYAYNQSGEKIGIVDPSKSGVQRRAGTCAPLSADDAQKSGCTTISTYSNSYLVLQSPDGLLSPIRREPAGVEAVIT